MRRAPRRAITAKRRRVAAGWLVVASGLGLSALTACSTGGGAAAPRAAQVVDTVVLGELPDPLDRPAPPEPPNLVATTTTTTEPPVVFVEAPIGDVVAGNRLLVIGDGVLVATADGAGGQLCELLVDQHGWTVGLAAESGTTIDYGAEVLDAVLGDTSGGTGTGTASGTADGDWDVVALLLGNIFDGDLAGFEGQLDALLERLAPRPIVVFTLTEADNEAAINDLYRARAELPNVVVVDWAEVGAADRSLLRNGGPLPTRAGSDRLVDLLVEQLGDAPSGSEGECLPASFLTETAG